METPAFGSILQSIQLLAGEQGISEIEAAREVIRTFRKMDQLWTEYLVAEGVERLKLSN
jgi:LPS sulfotransferase NodH